MAVACPLVAAAICRSVARSPAEPSMIATILTGRRGSYICWRPGYLLVADGTRPSTLERAREIYEQLCSFEEPPPSVEETAGAEPQANKPYVQFPHREVPFILLLNKSDLVEQWRIDKSNLQMLANKGWPVQVVSAKENEGVEEAFLSLGRRLLSEPTVKSQQ
jgi:signal recognition particle receptor subunit beta